jgi:cell wall-associated NlpC family hydrolase
MQLASVGHVLSEDQAGHLRRGDLIFWKGHVAIVRDADTIVHANAFHMATAIENTHDAIARIRAAGSEVVAIKRPPCLSAANAQS